MYPSLSNSQGQWGKKIGKYILAFIFWLYCWRTGFTKELQHIFVLLSLCLFMCFVFRRLECHTCSLVSNWEIRIFFGSSCVILLLVNSCHLYLLTVSVWVDGSHLSVSGAGSVNDCLQEKIVEERKAYVRFFTQHLCLLCLVIKIWLACFSLLSKAYELTGV